MAIGSARASNFEEEHMRTVAIMNYKGGVGKTVTAINFCAELAGRDKQVVLIDGDGQRNTTKFFKLTDDGERKYNTLYELLSGYGESYDAFLYPTVVPELLVVPASMELMKADISAIQSKQIRLNGVAELRDALAEDDAADYLVIDCPPSFSAATLAALAAADEVIVPMKLDAFSVDGMTELLMQVDSMRRINPRLRVAGILITMWTRSIAVRSAEDVVRRSKLPVFRQTIRRSTVVDEHTYSGKPLRMYKPTSGVAADYAAFADEYLENGGAYHGE